MWSILLSFSVLPMPPGGQRILPWWLTLGLTCDLLRPWNVSSSDSLPVPIMSFSPLELLPFSMRTCLRQWIFIPEWKGTQRRLESHQQCRAKPSWTQTSPVKAAHPKFFYRCVRFSGFFFCLVFGVFLLLPKLTDTSTNCVTLEKILNSLHHHLDRKSVV